LTFLEVVAAAFFGDVTHVANQTYNVASGAAFNGVSATFPPFGIQKKPIKFTLIYPRMGTPPERLNEFSTNFRSWRLADDPVCAQGDDAAAHTSYFTIFSEEAGAWVQTKLMS
ncbi:hypothetical protein diail_5671, partial [Diaporthe ilicicola]